MKRTLLVISLFSFSLALPIHAETKAAAKAKAAAETAEAQARDAVKKPADKVAEAVKSKAVPFYGEVTAVDPAAMTVSLGERTFVVTSETTIVDGDKTATIKEVKTGRKIGGSYLAIKGRNEVVKLNLGVKQAPAKEAPDKAADKKESDPAAKLKPKAAKDADAKKG